MRRHLSHTSLCPRCHEHNETVLHILRDCSESRAIWANLLSSADYQRFCHVPEMKWFKDNIDGSFQGIIEGYGNGEMEKWRNEDMEMEKWRNEDMEMEK